MMKKFTLLSVFVLSIFALHAQYTLSWDGEVLGDTVTIHGDPADDAMIFHAVLTNNSDESVAFKMQRRLIHLLDSTSIAYCWGTSCFPPNNTDSIEIARDTVILAPGASTSEARFSGDYLGVDENGNPTPQIGVIGTSLVEFTFYNQDNEDEKVTVVVRFVTSTDGIIDQVMANAKISDLYPNPATSYVSINYELPAQVQDAHIKIFNILGSVVKNVTMDKNATSLRVNVSDLTNGVYFYSIIVNNVVYKTKKLIVK